MKIESRVSRKQHFLYLPLKRYSRNDLFVEKNNNNHLHVQQTNLPTALACTVDLVVVLEAILTSRQPCEKLQCLYENLMLNNFRKMAVLRKI